ncbi:MAG TPA: Cof-type HAD-IIB family hydrolase [Ktedonobacteraceae bacterium]|nr:Cof-type HAD-IIB family hydrolase [Ktedonobacteraceae bacterium]
MYRLLAIDLDGTLLTPRPQKAITSRARHALLKAAEAGITIVIATGQNLAVLQHECGDLPLNGPQIIENGAIIADIHGVIYHQSLLPGEYILPTLSMLRVAGFYRAYHTLHRVYADSGAPRVREWYRPPVPPIIEVEDVANLFPLPCVKVVGIGTEEMIRAKRDEFERLYSGKLYVTQSSFDLVEFLHPGVSKGNALIKIAADLGLKAEEVVAFGDNHNDIGMLRFAGLGVAMGNAHDEVKAEADHVTLSNAEDGVAVAIEELVLPTLK